MTMLAMDPQDLELRWVPYEPSRRTEEVDMSGEHYIDVRVGALYVSWESPTGRITFGGHPERSKIHPDDIEEVFRPEWARIISEWWFSEADVTTTYGATSTPTSTASTTGARP